jgi:hypothetical protein
MNNQQHCPRLKEPDMVTMAKILAEDENPRITASLMARFKPLSGEFGDWIECPLTVYEPEFSKGVVLWKMENWIPNEDFEISTLMIYFSDHDDYAVFSFHKAGEAGDIVKPTYTMSGVTQHELEITERPV